MMKKCLKQAQPAEEGRKEEDISQGVEKKGKWVLQVEALLVSRTRKLYSFRIFVPPWYQSHICDMGLKLSSGYPVLLQVLGTKN